jgi:hypothetical protein
VPATYATTADVLALAPELAAFAGAQFDLIVDVITRELIDLGAWGDKALDGHRTIAAHFATCILNPTAATGSVTSRKIGQIGETYNVTMSTDDLSKTKYGLMHIALRNSLVGTMSFSDGSRGWVLPDGRVL